MQKYAKNFSKNDSCVERCRKELKYRKTRQYKENQFKVGFYKFLRFYILKIHVEKNVETQNPCESKENRKTSTFLRQVSRAHTYAYACEVCEIYVETEKKSEKVLSLQEI